MSLKFLESEYLVGVVDREDGRSVVDQTYIECRNVVRDDEQLEDGSTDQKGKGVTCLHN